MEKCIKHINNERCKNDAVEGLLWCKEHMPDFIGLGNSRVVSKKRRMARRAGITKAFEKILKG